MVSERVKSLIRQAVPAPHKGNSSHPLVALFEDMDSRVDALLGDQEVTSVTISGDATVVEGETLQLSVEVVVVNGASQEVTWESTDPDVATVDANGLVTGVAAGNVTITATSVFDSGVDDDHAVEVTAAEEEEEEEEE